jgi:flagellar hook-associated protein 2
MSTTSSTSAIFNGSSTYSSDFQSAITRSVQIASLPITQLQSDVTTFQTQSTELTSLDSEFTALQTSIQSIDQSLSGSSFSSTISNPAVVSTTVGDGAVEGDYAIQVSDVGAYATSLTASTWASPAGAANTYQLEIGSSSYNISPADNSAASVASAINSQEGDKVQATVVNVGSNATPDYRISLQSTMLGDTPVDLQLNGTSLQTPQAVGRVAQYIVNNSGLTVSSNTRSVAIATGLTVNLLSTSGSPVDITLTRSTAALSSALTSFVTAYNASVDGVDNDRGQAGGPLQGKPVMLSLSQALSSISTYNSPGSSISGLSGLGLTLNQNGHLTFSTTSLLSTELTNAAGVASFLGSASGGGFLLQASNILAGLEDPTTGLIKTSENDFQNQITKTNATITADQNQVSLLQTNLTNQMSAADAAIAVMQQQSSYLTEMFQAQQLSSQQITLG